MVALRYDDGSYDILCDDSINDGGDFFGYHNTMEENRRAKGLLFSQCRRSLVNQDHQAGPWNAGHNAGP